MKAYLVTEWKENSMIRLLKFRANDEYETQPLKEVEIF